MGPQTARTVNDNGAIRMKTGILNPSFKYIPACETNLRRTFARVRRELSHEKAEADRISTERQTKVTALRSHQ